MTCSRSLSRVSSRTSMSFISARRDIVARQSSASWWSDFSIGTRKASNIRSMYGNWVRSSSGNRISVGFVLIVHLVAKSRPVTLHRYCPMADIVVSAEPQEQICDHINRLNLHPSAIGQGSHSEMAPVDLVAAIDQEECPRHD